tara:strand:- start:387 stop:554 length:168 start_codon:yes stop_codon:yes gene_type:complete
MFDTVCGFVVEILITQLKYFLSIFQACNFKKKIWVSPFFVFCVFYFLFVFYFFDF